MMDDEADAELEATRRYVVAATQEIPVYADPELAGPAFAQLAPGSTLLAAELRSDASGSLRMRIGAPNGWIDPQGLEPAPAPRPVALKWSDFEAAQGELAPGDHYGIVFPTSHEAFEEMGSAFLTQAFRASGVLTEAQEVLRIEAYERVDSGGASITASFDAVYADPLVSGLTKAPTKLFVKMPAADVQRKFVSSHMLFGETEFARFISNAPFPVPVSRYVFGDYCRQTTNGILITERIPFGEHPIEKAHPKGLDALLPNAEEHYRALNVGLAQIVAFHKRGGLGEELEEVFPFRAEGSFMPAPPVGGLIDFITGDARHLLPDEMTTPSFVTRFQSDAEWILANLRPLAAALNKDVDYTGFCHANLNLDNAWFWRDEEDTLRAGLIDWGAAGQMSIGQAYYGMLFASRPERMLGLRRELVRDFVAEYERASGIELSANALLRRAKVACLLTLPMIVFASEQFLERYGRNELAETRSISDAAHEQDSGFQTMFAMLGNVLMEWLDPELDPLEVCRSLLGEQ
ncbi:MAG: hypothetical protein AB8G23_18040 [Myxococcota bacterium]